ncbi:MAG: 50S ribosomal protein L31 [Chloroflexi bacterium]|nr:50S ribosomal protein L31 [Chloroflexota bacterium]
MKAKIHPNYVEAQVTCACGHTWSTRSTKPTLRGHSIACLPWRNRRLIYLRNQLLTWHGLCA